MSISVDPQLVAFLLCDQVIQDVRSNKKTFVGVFDEIWAKNVPVVRPETYVAVVLTGCHGEQGIYLEIVHDGQDGEKSILKIQGRLNSKDPLEMVDLVFELRQLVFPNYGKYTLRLISEVSGNAIGYRPFRVRQSPDIVAGANK
jgi:hypothetical protein